MRKSLKWTLLGMLLTTQTACLGNAIPIIGGGLSIVKSTVEMVGYGQNPLTSGVDRTRVACKGFRVQTYSHVAGDPVKSDTPETIRQLRGHNAAYRALGCPK
jgi:hypothetical protein